MPTPPHSHRPQRANGCGPSHDPAGAPAGLRPPCPPSSTSPARPPSSPARPRASARPSQSALAQQGARVVVSSRDAGRVEADAAGADRRGAFGPGPHLQRGAQGRTGAPDRGEPPGAWDTSTSSSATPPSTRTTARSRTSPDHTFAKIMATNVQSNLWLAQMVAGEMRERKDGAIIYVSSIGGHHRLRRDRRLLHLQGRRLPARAQSCRRARAAQHPCQRHYARPRANGFCARVVGGRGDVRRPGSPERLSGVSASPRTSRESRSTWPRTRAAGPPARAFVVDGGTSIAG